MADISEMIQDGFLDEDILVEEIPNLDLYMDQIITFFSDRLLGNGYKEEDLLTKTMINNYSKEKIIQPVKGKKYNRQQIMQLLCILNLKQNLSLAEIKLLINPVKSGNDIDLEGAYTRSLELKKSIETAVIDTLNAQLSDIEVSKPEDRLAAILALSSLSTSCKRTASKVIEAAPKD